MEKPHKEWRYNALHHIPIFFSFTSVAVYFWPMIETSTYIFAETWWVGLALFIVGTALKWRVEYSHIGKIKQGLKTGKEELMTNGWYQLSRHPLYLCQGIIVTGAVLFAPTSMGVISLVAFFVLANITMSVEEQRLRERYGEEYSNYQLVVGRWFRTPFQIGVYLNIR